MKAEGEGHKDLPMMATCRATWDSTFTSSEKPVTGPSHARLQHTDTSLRKNFIADTLEPTIW